MAENKTLTCSYEGVSNALNLRMVVLIYKMEGSILLRLIPFLKTNDQYILQYQSSMDKNII